MTCEKSGYPSRRRCDDHIKKRTRDNPTLDLRAYLCPKCGFWHMTHVPDKYPRQRGGEAA